MEAKSRLQRKLEHIERFLSLHDGPTLSGFEDVQLIHQALSGLDWHEVDTSLSIWGKTMSFPLFINAITGGPQETFPINKELAQLAARHGIGMAVGSQTAGMNDLDAATTFRIARRANPHGLLIANVGANVSPAMAMQAVEMLEADALQLHINVAQELFMDEGDRHFNQVEENISTIVSSATVPVIAKEVGFGIAKETAHRLYACGVRWIDVGGAGGTNFIRIEKLRGSLQEETSLAGWGIPTAASILEVKGTALPLNVIASGGIRSGLDLLKAICLGATAGATVGNLLRALLRPGGVTPDQLLTQYGDDFKKGMLLMGCGDLAALASAPYFLKGATKEWYQARCNKSE